MFVHVVAEWGRDGGPKIPSYQRGLVWDPSDDLLLADSIDTQIPIGTLVLWSPGWRGSEEWIVDGQQRVAAMTRFVRGETAVYFDCDEDRYVIPDVVDPLRHAPIDIMFDWHKHSAWSKACFNWGYDADDDIHGLMCDRIDRIDGARGRMRDARVSLIIIRKNDEALVREIFRRINTTGKPMSEAEVFAGLARAKEEK